MYIALVFAFVAVCVARPMDDPAWEGYKLEFGKVYESEEDEVRYETWNENLRKMELHNAEYSNTYKQGVNQFSDMSDDEFEAKMCGCLRIPQHILNGSTAHQGQMFVPSNIQLPDSVNWVEKGYVTPVKSQGQCGSCYAFSATGSLEGQWFRKTGELPSLSESQIVDCSRRYGNLGCNGGWYQQAWSYIKDAGGSMSERTYPYKARVGWCAFSRKGVVATDHGFVNTRSGDENALKEAVATYGPVSVAIQVSGNFGRYKHGVYYNPNCRSDLWHLNHAVLVVGYGTESGQDYWLVKNSWGDHYGLGGYIKMARNRHNHCGIATKPSYPQV